MKLKGKVAIITGGAGGIGSATAKLFAQEGAKLIIADWNGEGAQAVASEIWEAGGEASFCKTNVASQDDIRDMVNQALDLFGRVDILMNNAGLGSAPAPIHAIDNDDWDRVINVSLKGVFLGMKHVLPIMMELGGGSIINVASIAGLIAAPNLAPYAAAKAGVIELTRTAAAEYSRYNIRCNALAPGWTKTAMVDTYIGGDADTERRMLKGIPMRRFGEVSEIAHAALFLAGDDARFIQGHTLVLDGGITII